MIAAAAAGADVVDVAIDSKYYSIFHLQGSYVYSVRHVGPDFAAAYGCRDLSPGTDRSWDGYSLC